MQGTEYKNRTQTKFSVVTRTRTEPLAPYAKQLQYWFSPISSCKCPKISVINAIKLYLIVINN